MNEGDLTIAIVRLGKHIQRESIMNMPQTMYADPKINALLYPTNVYMHPLQMLSR